MGPARRRAAATVGLLALLAGCGSATNLPGTIAAEPDRREVALDEATALPAVLGGVGTLGQQLLGSVPEGDNAFASPFGVAVTLAMLAEGASGQTAAELDRVLGAGGEERTDVMSALLGALAVFEADPDDVDLDDLPERPVLHVASGVVVDDGVEVGAAFLERLALGYGAGAQVTDLASEEGKAALDAWVRHHTAGLVEASAIQPSPDLVAVLQNAVLFAARWASPFVTADTADKRFTLADGTDVDVPTMQNWLEAPALLEDDVVAVRLPYTDGFALDVALRPDGPADPALLDGLGPALDAAEPVQVDLSLLRVDVATTTDLIPVLGGMGVHRAFTATAELEDIAPGVFVDQAVHQARLVIDEEGTVAAAVTEMGIATGAVVPEEVVVIDVDRPFVLQLVHVETGLPVFVGLVRDPRG